MKNFTKLFCHIKNVNVEGHIIVPVPTKGRGNKTKYTGGDSLQLPSSVQTPVTEILRGRVQDQKLQSQANYYDDGDSQEQA